MGIGLRESRQWVSRYRSEDLLEDEKGEDEKKDINTV
jgi:hypothetical protein